MTSFLSVRELHKTYQQGSEAVPVLSGLSLEVGEGETVAILGQSGSGKSTLLSLLAGLDQANHGEVQILGQNILELDETALARFRGHNLGIVFQAFHLLSHLTALENIALPLEILGQDGTTHKASEALGLVGLAHRSRHFPHQLSGGEKQRVAIARAFVTQPRLILADEPSGNLDTRTGELVMNNLFGLIGSQRMALILVTHNEALAHRCGRTLTLSEGKLIEAHPRGHS